MASFESEGSNRRDDYYSRKDCEPGPCQPSPCVREKTGRELLLELAKEYEELACYLQCLARSIPEEMSWQACKGLRHILTTTH